MKSFAYYNGVYDKPENIRISLSDRSIYFADSIYEVMIGGGGKIYQEVEHLDRLRNNTEAVGIHYPENISDVLHELVKIVDAREYTIYIQVSGVGGARLHSGRVLSVSNLLVIVTETNFSGVCEQIGVIIREDVRYRMCNRKTTNLLPSVLASIEAEKCGCDEAILIRDGIVTEGAKSNVFLLFDDMLLTHPIDCDILPGITRENIVRASLSLGLRVVEQKFSRMLLSQADEVIISSTTKFIRRVEAIDGVPLELKNGEVIDKIYNFLYSDFIRVCLHN